MIKEVINLHIQSIKNSPVQTPISNISVYKNSIAFTEVNSIAFTEVNSKRHIEFSSKKETRAYLNWLLNFS
ncbi:MAG: hypothetical protein CL599_07580 [Alteromonas sp.]|nr:hypothetical protein [Alteromonas sp.]OUX88436.1 MAG: hypothetical protein CBB95_07175 [Alteromonas sp. TMED35]|tara:strand:- start:1744 stop:1956 length:213 start_codon:yes stop_codon:yes gene_type:complete